MALSRPEVDEILKELPEVMPEAEALLELASSHPLAVALHQITQEINWWVERGEVHRTTLLVRPERSKEVVEALVDEKWRFTDGCRCIEFSVNQGFALPTPSGDIQQLYLQVDSGMLTVTDNPIMPDIEWREEDYRPFMGWS